MGYYVASFMEAVTTIYEILLFIISLNNGKGSAKNNKFVHTKTLFN